MNETKLSLTVPGVADSNGSAVLSFAAPGPDEMYHGILTVVTTSRASMVVETDARFITQGVAGQAHGYLNVYPSENLSITVTGMAPGETPVAYLRGALIQLEGPYLLPDRLPPEDFRAAQGVGVATGPQSIIDVSATATASILVAGDTADHQLTPTLVGSERLILFTALIVPTANPGADGKLIAPGPVDLLRYPQIVSPRPLVYDFRGAGEFVLALPGTAAPIASVSAHNNGIGDSYRYTVTYGILPS